VAGGDRTHGVGDLRDRDLFEEVTVHACLHRLVEVFLEIGDGQHDDLRLGRDGSDGAGGLDPAGARHAHVHDHDVRCQLADAADRLDPVRGLADDLDVGLVVEDAVEPAPEQRVIVDDHDPDRSGLAGGYLAVTRRSHPAVSMSPRSPSRRR
jgi:hypothetical protein